MPKPVVLELGECTTHAADIHHHARCISHLLNGTFTGAKFIEKVGPKFLIKIK